MLKGISPLLSPMLLKVLCEMGHGDTIVIADGNFPAETMGKEGIVIRMDGHGVPEILEAILAVFPLDQYVEKPVYLMERVPGDNADVSIWKTYEELILKTEERGVSVIDKLERFDFYEEAKKAYAVIATSETSQYANVILKKGCVLL
ncbi:MAG: fucose isomerase [Lachnospiraceae bacterium]|nr:fucose isomerase [Lachnospiraceae bacterium]